MRMIAQNRKGLIVVCNIYFIIVIDAVEQKGNYSVKTKIKLKENLLT
jgi:hypothetical protein